MPVGRKRIRGSEEKDISVNICAICFLDACELYWKSWTTTYRCGKLDSSISTIRAVIRFDALYTDRSISMLYVCFKVNDWGERRDCVITLSHVYPIHGVEQIAGSEFANDRLK